MELSDLVEVKVEGNVMELLFFVVFEVVCFVEVRVKLKDLNLCLDLV